MPLAMTILFLGLALWGWSISICFTQTCGWTGINTGCMDAFKSSRPEVKEVASGASESKADLGRRSWRTAMCRRTSKAESARR
jgi:hypothetical protein